ncbi:MAG: FAD-binding protein [Bryobacteraceae bacterium]
MPASSEELASALAGQAALGNIIRLGGAFSKDAAGGPLTKLPSVTISTTRLRTVRRYEPSDLTVSVDAGMPWAELSALLERNRQTVPIDPPWFERSTVGGVVAANYSGPRRRAFGTARDHVIGMRFATLEGKVVESGGMVVKNVAGLDMGKLMIGSWGTLAAMVSVNFKLTPIPECTRTFVRPFEKLADAVESRNGILRGVLQPWAVDLLNPKAANEFGYQGWTLALQAGGSAALMTRYATELAGFEALADETPFWTAIREFPTRGVIARRFALDELAPAMAACTGSAIARAGSGILYEASTGFAKPPEPEGFEIMRRVKAMFDPNSLLNPGRLNGLL